MTDDWTYRRRKVLSLLCCRLECSLFHFRHFLSVVYRRCRCTGVAWGMSAAKHLPYSQDVATGLSFRLNCYNDPKESLSTFLECLSQVSYLHTWPLTWFVRPRWPNRWCTAIWVCDHTFDPDLIFLPEVLLPSDGGWGRGPVWWLRCCLSVKGPRSLRSWGYINHFT